MSKILNTKVGYGKSQPLIDIFNQPIVSLRDPNIRDKGPIGQIWVNKTNNTVWMITSFLNGNAVWTEIDNSVAATGITWTTEVGNAINLANNHGYVLTNLGIIATTLPLVSPIGSEIWLVTQNSTAPGAGVLIAQNAGQYIKFDNATTTPGIAGGIGWVGLGNNINPLQLTIHMTCTVANTCWSIMSSSRNYSTIV